VSKGPRGGARIRGRIGLGDSFILYQGPGAQAESIKERREAEKMEKLVEKAREAEERKQEREKKERAKEHRRAEAQRTAESTSRGVIDRLNENEEKKKEREARLERLRRESLDAQRRLSLSVSARDSSEAATPSGAERDPLEIADDASDSSGDRMDTDDSE
jgi:hypothetical protein